MADDIDQIVDNLKQPSTWVRVLFMIGFAVLLYVVIAPLFFVLMIVQALFALITGETNSNLRYLGATLAQYVLQILQFISYNSDVQPFPFTDFPAVDDEDDTDSTAESEHASSGGDKNKATDGESDTASTAAASKPVKRKTTAKKKTASRKKANGKSAADKPADNDSDTETKA